MKATLATILGLSMMAAPAAAQWDPGRVDSHAPIGVMGDHRHEPGEVMLSYRYVYMGMKGSRVGTEPIVDEAIVGPSGSGFTVTPTEMPMQMHMLGVMYGASHDLTMMAMVPFLDVRMDHLTRAGDTFTTESGGIGDVRVGGMIAIADLPRQSAHFNAFASIPTGSIEERDALPTSMGEEVQLPYPMQVGSGTWDLHPALTWLVQGDQYSWGFQGNATIRLGDNDNGYTLGDQYGATLWAARVLNRNFSAGVRGEVRNTANIEGTDSLAATPPTFVPTADPNLRGGTVVEVGPSLNFYVPRLSAFRIAAEALFPVYRDLDGPQLERDWTLVLGAQVTPVG